MFKKILGFVEKVTNWATQAFNPISAVVAVANKFVATAKQMKETYDVGRSLLAQKQDLKREKEEVRERIQVVVVSPPPISLPKPSPKIKESKDSYKDRSSSNRVLETRIRDIKEHQLQVEDAQNRLEDTQNRLLLQTKILELLTTSQTIERFTNNIELHASNLNIHYMALRNTLGILDFANRQNKGVKAAIGKLNYIIRLLNKERVVKRGQLTPIEHIDLERKHGAISIWNQYNAFAQTQELLETECEKLINSLDGHVKQVEELREYAKGTIGEQQVKRWLDKNVVPNLKDAQEKTTQLRKALSEIPKLPVNTKGKDFQKLLTAGDGSSSAKYVRQTDQKKQIRRKK